MATAFVRKQISLALLLTLFSQLPLGAREAVTGPGGATSGSGGMPGSAGLAEDQNAALQDVQKAKKHGLNSREYIASLIELGMQYNRQGAATNAQKTLAKALAIIDKGALKPTPGSVEEKSPTVVEHHDGTVSATINKPAAPYEETLEQLLPAIVEADLHSNHLQEGETHVKRWIEMARTNRIHRVPALIMAYNQYSAILTKLHRNKEADHYKQEADKINKSIIPL